jgi:hypothetical protein
MIATLSEIKVLLQITDSIKDALITELIPILESDIFDFCNSNFDYSAYKADGKVYAGGNTVSFTSSTKTITDSVNDMPFLAGQNIYVSGSRFNDGFKSILTGGTGSIVVNETLFDETAFNDVSIKLVKVPESFKSILADYIDFKINKKEIGVTSESVPGGFSKSYSGDGGEIPEGIKKRLPLRVVGIA